jgi:hypothetical protein
MDHRDGVMADQLLQKQVELLIFKSLLPLYISWALLSHGTRLKFA